MKTTVSERGQVTIPKKLRDRLGLDPGTILMFSEEHGRLIGVRLSDRDPVDAVYGVLDAPRGSDALLEELRGLDADQ